MSGSLAVESLAAGEGLTFLEQLHAVAIVTCSNPAVPYITAIDGKRAVLTRGSCGSWGCLECGARNARQWLARVLNHMNSVSKVKRWFFLTITAHKSWRGARASRKNLQQGWKKLYNRMRRKYGCNEYVKVWEYHKDGSWHLHVLYGRKVGKKWLKDNSAECGMGYMCDSSASKNAGKVAGYIAKYLLKSLDNSHMYEKGMRRIEASRSWAKLPELFKPERVEYLIHQTREGQDRTIAHLSVSKLTSVIDRRPAVD